MKIAIPTKDQTNIFKHFGRTPGFLLIEVADGKINSKDYITNTFTGHAQGQHLSDNEHGNGHGTGQGNGHNHSHAGIFEALGECEVVIAGGMGRGLYDQFSAQNTKVFITEEININTAVNLFLNNRLDNNTDITCSH